MEREVYSVKEAARLMGISEQRVRALLAEGRIKGKRLGHDWVVLELGYAKKKRGRRPKEDEGGDLREGID